MSEPNESLARSVCSMYRRGTSLRTLQSAFGLDEAEIIGVLRAGSAVVPEPGESEDHFLDRVRHDVKHAV